MRLTALLIAASLAGGCGSMRPVPNDQPIAPLAGPAPVRGSTQVDAALRCLAEHFPRDVDLRLSVNDLTDGTGATLSGDSLSRALTQRPDVMMTIGLAKTGVRMVNRSSTGVAEWELRQAMQKYIGDGRAFVDPQTQKPVPYRPVLAGALLGSTHYVSGALSELNWNVSSQVAEAGVGGFTIGARSYRISMAADLIVTRTRSTEIVIARSYSKQLVGQETGAGLFRFFDVGSGSSNWGPKEVFEFNVGKQANEPVQTAVRWMLETAAYDIVSELTGTGEFCDHLLPEGSRPVRAAKAPAATAEPARVATTPQAAPTPAPGPATATASATPASKVSINGVNVIEDEGAVVVRVDTSTPLDRLPAVDTSIPLRLAFEFPDVRNAVGPFARQTANGVRGVTLLSTPTGSRVVVELAQPHDHKMVKEGRSLIVQLLPRVAARSERLSPGAAAAAAAPAADDGGGVSGADVLAPRNTSSDPLDEAIRQMRRR